MQKFSEIILHIGLHKTGTTTIQTQLAHHAEALEAQGLAVYAPREFEGNSGWLFHALLDRPRMNGERVDPRVIEEFEAHARRTSAERLLLSGEALNFATAEHWKDLAAYFKKWLKPEARVQIWMVVRQPEDWLASYRNQATKHRAPFKWDIPFELWLDHAQVREELSPMWERSCALEIWRMEDWKAAGIWTGFAEALGIPQGQFPAQARGHANRSMALEARWLLAELVDDASVWTALKDQIQRLPGSPDGLTKDEAAMCWRPEGAGPAIQSRLQSARLPTYTPRDEWLDFRHLDVFASHRAWRAWIRSLDRGQRLAVRKALRNLARRPHLKACSWKSRWRLARLAWGQ